MVLNLLYYTRSFVICPFSTSSTSKDNETVNMQKMLCDLGAKGCLSLREITREALG